MASDISVVLLAARDNATSRHSAAGTTGFTGSDSSNTSFYPGGISHQGRVVDDGQVGNEYRLVLDEFHAGLYTHKHPTTIALICLYIPVFIVALIGNVIVLFNVLPNRRLRNMTNCFLVNLAVADLFVTLVCIPMAVGQAIYRVWVYGHFMCKITAYLQGVSVAASVFTIMTMSVERYLAIRHPMTLKKVCSGRHALKLVAFIWILSILIMIPIPLARTVQKLDSFAVQMPVSLDIDLEFCNEVWKSATDRRIYDLSLFVFVFVMPGCFVTSAYVMIGCTLWTEGSQFVRCDSKVGRAQAERVMAGRRRVARMLVVLAVLFAFCWMPYHLLTLYLDFEPDPHGTGALETLPFTIFLGHFNSALNPILYCCMKKHFKKLCYRAMKCLRIRRKPKSSAERVDMVVMYTPLGDATKSTISWRKRPLVRFGSGSSNLTSTTGSLRFSRSGNSMRSGARGENKLNINPTEDRHQHHAHYLENVPKPLARRQHTSHHHNDDQQDTDDDWQNQRHRKDMFDVELNIPTTINEEPSRCSRLLSITLERSMVPPLEFERSPEISRSLESPLQTCDPCHVGSKLEEIPLQELLTHSHSDNLAS